MFKSIKDAISQKIDAIPKPDMKMPDVRLPTFAVPSWSFPALSLGDEAKTALMDVFCQASGSLVSLFDDVVASDETKRIAAGVAYQFLPTLVRILVPEDRFLLFVAGNWTMIYTVVKNAGSAKAAMPPSTAQPLLAASPPPCERIFANLERIVTATRSLKAEHIDVDGRNIGCRLETSANGVSVAVAVLIQSDLVSASRYNRIRDGLVGRGVHSFLELDEEAARPTLYDFEAGRWFGRYDGDAIATWLHTVFQSGVGVRDFYRDAFLQS